MRTNSTFPLAVRSILLYVSTSKLISCGNNNIRQRNETLFIVRFSFCFPYPSVFYTLGPAGASLMTIDGFAGDAEEKVHDGVSVASRRSSCHRQRVVPAAGIGVLRKFFLGIFEEFSRNFLSATLFLVPLLVFCLHLLTPLQLETRFGDEIT